MSSFEDFADTPTLIPAKRTTLHDKHAITDMTLIALVVRLHFGAASQDFFIPRVHDRPLDGNHHGLLHAVTDDQSR